MRIVDEAYDIVVCGGGLAGLCAAVAAARNGSRTCLLHNRPVLGGNSSSEIGVTPHGAAAFHAYARETGIISEALIEERAKNHAEIYENGWTNSVWDLVLYDLVQSTPGLTLHLNTEVHGVEKESERRIDRILARVHNAELSLNITGRFFIDCTGDGLVAHLGGCPWRMGSEARSEFHEPHAPEKASDDTMGNSIHFLARDIGRPAPFKAPDWAIHYEDASFFYDQGRIPKDIRGGFWWLEIGVPFHTIYDNEKIRHELTRHALGVWDWMKNRDPNTRERASHYALDWIGQVPGKRESRRIMGHHLLTENDVLQKREFEDEIAFGGWFVDLHTPGGLLAKSSEPSAVEGEEYDSFSDYSAMSYCGPYGLPLRILLARDMDNLLMAGRNVSVTHAALGTVRVMGTTALLGQAAGTAAAVAVRRELTTGQLCCGAMDEIQQTLLREGCFLPGVSNRDPADLARSARASASSSALIHGTGPSTPGFHEGLSAWRDQPQYASQRLEVRRGQLIALESGSIDRIELCLENCSQSLQAATLELHRVDHIWDYRCDPGPPIARGSVTVPASGEFWVTWDVGVKLTDWSPGSWVRLDVFPNSQLCWKISGRVIPGHVAMYAISPQRMRRFGHGHTLSYRIVPAQRAFDPSQVLSGVSRPHRQTNLWISDPAQPLPQHVELHWEQPRSLSVVEVTFPGHLLREYHAYGPLYRDPQCARDYSLECWVDGVWRPVLTIRENYQRRRVHRFAQAVETNGLRVVVLATHGEPSAAIYEIRAYE